MSEKRPSGRSPKLVSERSFAALIRLFRQSPKWAKYSDGTKELWGRELDLMSRPDTLGAKTIDEMRPALAQAYLDALDGRPGKQTAARAVLVQLEGWAIVRDLLPRQITTGLETDRPQGGHKPWTDAQVELGERNAAPYLSRVITLAANTGQRGSDLIRMGPTDIETYQGISGINVKQKKTGRELWVPITSALAAVMEAWERRPGPFLTRADGSAWPSRRLLSLSWNWHRNHNEALMPLRGLVMHGLRGTACVRLRRAGATIPQIADMVGMSEPMVARYCRFSIQKENAVAGVINLERTLKERAMDKSRKVGR